MRTTLDFERKQKAVDATADFLCALGCPRCGASLIHHEPGRNWRRWFECRECLSGWCLSQGYLVMGRDRTPEYMRL